MFAQSEMKGDVSDSKGYIFFTILQQLTLTPLRTWIILYTVLSGFI